MEECLLRFVIVDLKKLVSRTTWHMYRLPITWREESINLKYGRGVGTAPPPPALRRLPLPLRLRKHAYDELSQIRMLSVLCHRACRSHLSAAAASVSHPEIIFSPLGNLEQQGKEGLLRCVSSPANAQQPASRAMSTTFPSSNRMSSFSSLSFHIRWTRLRRRCGPWPPPRRRPTPGPRCSTKSAGPPTRLRRSLKNRRVELFYSFSWGKNIGCFV